MQAFGVFVVVTWALLPVLAYFAARHRGAGRLVAWCAAVFGVLGLAVAVLWPSSRPLQRLRRRGMCHGMHHLGTRPVSKSNRKGQKSWHRHCTSYMASVASPLSRSSHGICLSWDDDKLACKAGRHPFQPLHPGNLEGVRVTRAYGGCYQLTDNCPNCGLPRTVTTLKGGVLDPHAKYDYDYTKVPGEPGPQGCWRYQAGLQGGAGRAAGPGYPQGGDRPRPAGGVVDGQGTHRQGMGRQAPSGNGCCWPASAC